jgi:hypothetical protein
MSKKAEIKPYAITLTVKPKATATVRYSSITYRGMSFAGNPTKAKDQAIEKVIKSFDPTKEPKITKEVIFIKECKLHGDFFTGLETTD